MKTLLTIGLVLTALFNLVSCTPEPIEDDTQKYYLEVRTGSDNKTESQISTSNPDKYLGHISTPYAQYPSIGVGMLEFTSTKNATINVNMTVRNTDCEVKLYYYDAYGYPRPASNVVNVTTTIKNI